jgi:hypothetical protein
MRTASLTGQGVRAVTRLIIGRKFGTASKAVNGVLVMDGGSGTNPGGAILKATSATVGSFRCAYDIGTEGGTTVLFPANGQFVVGGTIAPDMLRTYSDGVWNEAAPPAGDTWTDPAITGPIGVFCYPNGTSEFGVEAEFIAAAAWDEVLSDSEIEQATQELLGTWTPREIDARRIEALVATEPITTNVLADAVWRVDAGSVDGDRLTDLSGGGRDAVFGAGSASPVVLPFSGETYIHFPNPNGNALGTSNLAGSATSCRITVRAKLGQHNSQPRYFWQTGGTTGPQRPWYIRFNSSADLSIESVKGDGTVGEPLSLGLASSKEWHRFTQDNTATVTYEDSDDGVNWSVRATVQHTGDRIPFNNLNVYRPFGGGSAGAHPIADWYSFKAEFDGVVTHEVHAADVDSDYVSIPNRAASGAGPVDIARADSGMKTAVVNRDLLLFGGAQHARAVPGPDLPSQVTALLAVRYFDGTYYPENDMLSFGGQIPGATGWRITIPNSPSQDTLDTSHTGITRRFVRTGATVYGERVIAVRMDPAADTASITSAGNTGTLTDWELPDVNGSAAGIGVMNVPTGGTGRGMEGEFIGAAIWPTALSDAEIAQATSELLGTWTPKQIDARRIEVQVITTQPTLEVL